MTPRVNYMKDNINSTYTLTINLKPQPKFEENS